MFTPSNMLLKYLNAQPRDIYDIVGALMGYINADPYFKTNDFDMAIQYVITHGVSEDELYSSFDPSLDYDENMEAWNDEYYSYARVFLKDNFCKKRIAHVKAVAQKLHPVVKSEPVVSSQTSHYASDNRTHTPNDGSNNQRRRTISDDNTQRRYTKPPKKANGRRTQKRSFTTSQKCAVVVGTCVLLGVALAVVIVSTIK